MSTPPPPPPPKKRRLSAFLLKEGVDIDMALKDPGELKEYDLDDSNDLQGALYVKPRRPKPPWWIEFLQPAVTDELPKETVGTMSAVLLLTVDERMMAFTFGFGRHLLKPHVIEPHFGLKTALNAINPRQLRSLDLVTYDDVALLTKRQVSRSSSVDTFLVDQLRDMLNKVVGSPQDEAFGTRLTGSDSITFTMGVKVERLVTVGSRLIETFKKDSYKQDFGWIDRVNNVRDPSLISRLDDKLDEALCDGGKPDVLYLAPPEIVDWENVEYFKYSSQPKKDDREFQELELDDYLSTFQSRRKPLSIKALKDDHVRYMHAELQAMVGLTSVYRCVIFETDLDGDRYVLLAGEWAQIDNDFVKSVEDQLSRIKVSEHEFPSHRDGEYEEDYLKRAVDDIADATLLDQKLIEHGGGYSKIELCDILTDQGGFIHAKRRSRSSTLSHLWAQGATSAQLFLSDPDFRTKARSLVGSDRMELIPEQPERGANEVTYLIIGADPVAPWKSLPFFSKVALMQASANIRSLGFPVRIAGTAPAGSE